jgi:hypothetical protein
MKIKVFSAFSESSLERKVNSFITDTNINVLQIQFQASFGSIYAMVSYEQKAVHRNFDDFKNI